MKLGWHGGCCDTPAEAGDRGGVMAKRIRFLGLFLMTVAAGGCVGEAARIGDGADDNLSMDEKTDTGGILPWTREAAAAVNVANYKWDDRKFDQRAFFYDTIGLTS